MKLMRLLFTAKTAIFRTVPLMLDTRVPAPLKLAAMAIGLLVISPIDIFGDIPVLGALDDAALLTILCVWFVRQAGKHIERTSVRPIPAPMLAGGPFNPLGGA